MLKDEIKIAFKKFRVELDIENKRHKKNLLELGRVYKIEIQRIRNNYKSMKNE